jgi:hypothetical protein
MGTRPPEVVGCFTYAGKHHSKGLTSLTCQVASVAADPRQDGEKPTSAMRSAKVRKRKRFTFGPRSTSGPQSASESDICRITSALKSYQLDPAIEQVVIQQLEAIFYVSNVYTTFRWNIALLPISFSYLLRGLHFSYYQLSVDFYHLTSSLLICLF